jgi:membrane protein YdbS with pleckstrin-like domain
MTLKELEQYKSHCVFSVISAFVVLLFSKFEDIFLFMRSVKESLLLSAMSIGFVILVLTVILVPWYLVFVYKRWVQDAKRHKISDENITEEKHGIPENVFVLQDHKKHKAVS